MRKLFVIVTLAAMSTLACASGTGGGTRASGSRNLISAAQLAESVDRNVYDVIRRLRPSWIRPRGNLVAIAYVDQTRYGELERLQSIAIEIVEEIRYLSASDATTRFGTGHPAGIIQVITKH